MRNCSQLCVFTRLNSSASSSFACNDLGCMSWCICLHCSVTLKFTWMIAFLVNSKHIFIQSPSILLSKVQGVSFLLCAEVKSSLTCSAISSLVMEWPSHPGWPGIVLVWKLKILHYRTPRSPEHPTVVLTEAAWSPRTWRRKEANWRQNVNPHRKAAVGGNQVAAWCHHGSRELPCSPPPGAQAKLWPYPVEGVRQGPGWKTTYQ